MVPRAGLRDGAELQKGARLTGALNGAMASHLALPGESPNTINGNLYVDHLGPISAVILEISHISPRRGSPLPDYLTKISDLNSDIFVFCIT